MKKSLLALVIASTLPMAAFADVVVYGKANVSLQQADEGDESQIELVSNASRIGIKGGEEIASGLKAIYQFEYETAVDDGDNSAGDGQTFKQRNIYVGLQGSAGTVMAGMFDTPTKVAQEKVDLFNDLEGDIAFLVDGEIRAKNIVQYTTPTFADAFAVNVAFVAAEAGEEADDGIATSFTYTTSALYAAAAFEQDVTGQGVDIARLVGRYTIGSVQLGALFEQSSYDEAGEEYDADAWLLSAKFNVMTELALKVQYGTAAADYDDGFTEDEFDGESLSLGVDYTLSKNAVVYAYYTQETADENSEEVMDDNWLGVGMELKF